MSKSWIEVVIETSDDAGELLGMLQDPDACGGWQENGTVRLYWPEHRFTADTLRRLQAVVPAPLRVQTLPSADWNAIWKEGVRPFRVGRRIVIRPSWHEVELGSRDVELIIDPKDAFGSGHHATTQLLLEWLEDRYETGAGAARVLDLGTGSGILAMAALRLGAQTAVGIDHDPAAIRCANESATLNRFGTELQFRVATLVDVEMTSYDLVVANLDRRTILGSIGLITAACRAGAVVLLSGLLAEDREDIARAFDEAGAAIQAARERDGWSAIEIGLNVE